jgi:predicted ribosomally synthesized peptide with SipW-like signal peptide
VPVMKTRNALGLIVAGTLVVGAGTGSTLALWHDSATAAARTTTAGTISVTVNNSTTASFAGPTALTAGVAKIVTATVKNASAVAPNLRMQVYLDSVTSNQAAWTSNVEVAAATYTTTCAAATSGYVSVGATNANIAVTSTDMASNDSANLCVSVRLKSSAPVAAYGKSGTLTLTLRGQQVRQ